MTDTDIFELLKRPENHATGTSQLDPIVKFNTAMLLPAICELRGIELPEAERILRDLVQRLGGDREHERFRRAPQLAAGRMIATDADFGLVYWVPREALDAA